MRINMTPEQAQIRADELYGDPSRPLSINTSPTQAQNVEWWISNPKSDDFSSQRHDAAISLYLELARHADQPVPEYCFPAAFEFGNDKRRPDKGVISGLEQRLSSLSSQ